MQEGDVWQGHSNASGNHVYQFACFQFFQCCIFTYFQNVFVFMFIFIGTFLKKKCLFFCGRTSIFLFYLHNYGMILKGKNSCCNTYFLTTVWKVQNFLFSVYMPYLQEWNILTNGWCCTGSCMSLHVIRKAVSVCIDFFWFSSSEEILQMWQSI